MNWQYFHSATAEEGILFSQVEVRSFQVSKLITVLYKDLKFLVNAILLKVKHCKIDNVFSPCFIRMMSRIMSFLK